MSSTSTSTTQTLRPRARTAMACTPCRDRKVKCTPQGEGMACERCANLSKENECKFEPVAATTSAPQTPQTSPPSTSQQIHSTLPTVPPSYSHWNPAQTYPSQHSSQVPHQPLPHQPLPHQAHPQVPHQAHPIVPAYPYPQSSHPSQSIHPSQQLGMQQQHIPHQYTSPVPAHPTPPTAPYPMAQYYGTDNTVYPGGGPQYYYPSQQGQPQPPHPQSHNPTQPNPPNTNMYWTGPTNPSSYNNGGGQV